jgi:phenylacetate-CoA ligase
MVAAPHLTDEERFPLLTEKGRRLLEELREHPHAPRYNMACGDQLAREAIERVSEFEHGLGSTPPRWSASTRPSWVEPFAETCLRDVPVYRKRGGSASDFDSLPTVSRMDLARDLLSFVPDSESVGQLIVYYTSGAHGRPIDILSHPEAAAKRIPLFRAALARHGVRFDGAGRRVAIAFICSQKFTLTFATLSTYLSEAGHVKINLNPSEWRDPDDRARFLDDINAEIWTGDPLSFVDAAGLPVKARPKAMLSSAMALLPETKRRLEERFGCPVVDLYSTCESGPIAVAAGERFEVLPHDLYVEVVDRDGRPCREGERGEVTLTGGRNPFFPMLRYRTGDWAAMSFEGGVPAIVGFEGREPVVFTAEEGRRINNIDVTTVLRPFFLAQFALHQNADGSLLFRYRGAAGLERAIEPALRTLFGPSQPIELGAIGDDEWKVIPYGTDMTL